MNNFFSFTRTRKIPDIVKKTRHGKLCQSDEWFAISKTNLRINGTPHNQPRWHLTHFHFQTRSLHVESCFEHICNILAAWRVLFLNSGKKWACARCASHFKLWSKPIIKCWMKENAQSPQKNVNRVPPATREDDGKKINGKANNMYTNDDDAAAIAVVNIEKKWEYLLFHSCLTCGCKQTVTECSTGENITAAVWTQQKYDFHPSLFYVIVCS